MTMNPDIKEQWVDALNSGEYFQGKEELRTKDDTYCCLGVLCDLAVKAGIAKWERADDTGSWVIAPADHDYSQFGFNGDVSDAWLPVFIRNWAGLNDDNPQVRVEDEDMAVGISHLNDNKGMNFEKIAEVIQEQL